MRILMIISASTAPRLAVTIDHFIEPYYEFIDGGADVVLASPDGGDPIATSTSLDAPGASLRFRSDHRARDDFAGTLCLDQVFAEDFDAAYYIGSYDEATGASDHPIAKIVQKLLALNKPVALVSIHPRPDFVINGAPPRVAAKAVLGMLRGTPDGPD